MLARAAMKKIEVSEVPIKTIYKDKYKGVSFFSGSWIGLKMIIWRIMI